MSKKTPIQIMEELLCNLPEKDIKFAEKFIKERDFEALQELVISDIQKIEKKCNPVSLEPENLEMENKLDTLCKLRNEVESYLSLLGYSNDEIYGTSEDLDDDDDEFFYTEDY